MTTMLAPRLLVAMAVLGAVTVAVQCRPTVESGEPSDEEFPDNEPSAVLVIPSGNWDHANTAFGSMLRDRLSAMNERDLATLETALRSAGAADTEGPDGDMMMGDMMMGDMPQDDAPVDTGLRQVAASPDDGDYASITRLSPDPDNPEDNFHLPPDRTMRIETIQNNIIAFIGRNAGIEPPSPLIKTRPTSVVPNETNQETDAFLKLYENVNNFPSYPSAMFTEKTQSFYPTCELPKHTNDEVWNTRETMNLMFNISFPKSSNGVSVNVNTARLRLFKQHVTCYSQSSNETDDSQPACEPVLLEETLKRSNNNLSAAGVVPVIIDDRQIRVSIYAYTRSLKRKRVKRKLLDSRMLPYYSEKWTEWNIRNAVKAWHKNPSRNYGISVEVEDEDGNLLPVNQFFRPMNCTGDAQMMTPKPMPGFLMDAVDNLSGASNNTALAFSFNTHLFPIIDIATVEMPESEAKNAMLFQYTNNAFAQQFADRAALAATATRLPPAPQGAAGDLAAEHRTRHGAGRQQRNNNNGTTTAGHGGSLSKDGRELRDQIIVQRVIQRNVPAPTTEPPDQ